MAFIHCASEYVFRHAKTAQRLARLEVGCCWWRLHCDRWIPIVISCWWPYFFKYTLYRRKMLFSMGSSARAITAGHDSISTAWPSPTGLAHTIHNAPGARWSVASPSCTTQIIRSPCWLGGCTRISNTLPFLTVTCTRRCADIACMRMRARSRIAYYVHPVIDNNNTV